MVGVPGKYKGCETCRRRRVKCSNERPYCKKCTNSGRECEGYEREMVFITGTPENKGRVASHPKKVTPPSSSKRLKPRYGASEAGSMTPECTPERDAAGARSLVPAQPLTSAWDDYIALDSHGTPCYTLMTALQVSLQSVSAHAGSREGDDFTIALAPYTPPELPTVTGSNMFNTSARCLVHLPNSSEMDDMAQNICVFLFEHTLGAPPDTSFELPSISPGQRMGPQSFISFPNHHFFVRVYRPMSVSIALLNRQATFLSEPDWTTTPWEKHPKSLLDQLLDMISFLPSLLEKTDGILPLQATLSRRHEAQKSLHNCLTLEVQFDQWLQIASQGTPEQSLSYWAEEMASSSGGLPFSHSYTFQGGVTGLMFLYYWMALIPFYRCIECLYNIIFEPVMEDYPDMWPDLPPGLQLNDLTRYQQTRELAANICRGLDSVLERTVQPDLLVAPMTVALDLYRDVNASSQDGLLEILWLEAFRGRLVEKGQYVATVLQSNSWFELARF